MITDLEGILTEIDVHAIDFPRHGINCACMDTAIRKVRALIREVATSEAARQRMHYVLTTASRW